MGAETEGFAKRLDDLRDRDFGFIARRPDDEQGEFVPAKPSRGDRAVRRALEPCREVAEQRIAGIMTEAIVELLEAVDVEQQQRELAAIGLHRLDRRLQLALEGDAIEQTGQ